MGEALDGRGANRKFWAEQLNISVPYFYSVFCKATAPGSGSNWNLIVKTMREQLGIIPVDGGWKIMSIREYIDDFRERENEMNRRLQRRRYGN